MRRVMACAGLVAVLVSGLVVGGPPSLAASSLAPSSAAAASGGLLGPGPPLPAEAAVWSSDGVLKKGRQQHAYRYQVETDEPYWSLELFVLDSRNHQVASAFQAVGADPMSGRANFRFWSQATRPGRFTIRARLTWGDYDREERWLEPRTFRLRRP